MPSIIIFAALSALASVSSGTAIASIETSGTSATIHFDKAPQKDSTPISCKCPGFMEVSKSGAPDKLCWDPQDNAAYFVCKPGGRAPERKMCGNGLVFRPESSSCELSPESTLVTGSSDNIFASRDGSYIKNFGDDSTIFSSTTIKGSEFFCKEGFVFSSELQSCVSVWDC